MLEVAVAVTLFVFSVGVLTAIVTSSLLNRTDTNRLGLVDEKLGSMVTQVSGLSPETLASGDFDVPDRCPGVVEGLGAAGVSCVVVAGRTQQVLWQVEFVDDTAGEGRSGWIDVVARTQVGSRMQSRTASVPIPFEFDLTPFKARTGLRVVSAETRIRQGETGVLRLTVVNEDTGTVAADAQLFVTVPETPTVSGTTGANGTVEMELFIPDATPAGPLQLTVGGFEQTEVVVDVLPATRALVSLPTSLTVSAGDLATISVQAIGDDGALVEGQMVEAAASGPGLEVSQRIATDEFGVAEFLVRFDPGEAPSGNMSVTFTAGSETLVVPVQVL